MSRYFISLFLLLPMLVLGQESNQNPAPQDSVQYKEQYGLRVGVDLSRLVLSFADEDYTGLELVGDYRLTDKLYLAAELGNEEKTQTEDLGGTPLYNYTTSGSYIKLGVDLNTYQNWFGMDNLISIGGRYSFATFSQTLNEYQIFDSNRLFVPDGFLPGALEGEEFSGRSASWLEFVAGVKAELFANIYIGLSVRVGFLVTNDESDRFPNLWIPGFNKVTDASNFGVGYNYTISYFIPLYKKTKRKKAEEPE
ncbi:DUF6048 family protein [Flagellimonas allohymeniacidonis]|uniref:Outer membrane protein beta-barrel domain-containing protein n=1 Tax=Flagellimonas allohymeniacidonis TaxID=2517819 RepID=A0A4Q8QCU0_9FLAO|nr:DUF6048 family protein [Allomuricauda hymeniacidonis]TAI48242.1 hypothetical protein EW142_00050 [Allomuricauda hymeniacidonis]